MSLTDSFQSGVQGAQGAASGAGSILHGGDFLNSLTDKGPAFLRPKTVIGIGGFVFDYAGEIGFNRDADVTDHYLEDNSTANDHIGIRPARLMMKGIQSEVFQAPQGGVLGAIAFVQGKLGTLPALLGKYTPQAVQKMTAALTQAQKAVNQLDSNISRVKNLVGLFGKANPGNTKQSQAYAFLDGLMTSRQVFLVETPFRIFDNMVITSLGIVQPEQTKYQAEIVITLKELRFVQVKTSSVTNPTLAGRAAAQRTPQADNGRTKGGSFFYDIAVAPFKSGT